MFSRATAVPGAVAETTDLPLQPEFHYSRLMTRYPNLTTAQLINANNYNIEDVISGMIDPQATPSIPADADVVVAGAGMASLIYAIELKRSKPEASIVVLEKSTAPIYKIGESTLSPFSRFCQSNILPVAYMLRLFSLKEGLDFALVDRKGGEVYYQDIGGLDYSFQLERKISELLFTMKAQQLGIKVFYGVSVVPDKSDISSSPSSKTVGYSIASSLINGPGTWSTVHASVDAVAPKIMRSPARTNALARWWQNVTSFGNSLPKSPSKSKFEKRSMSSLGHQSMATRSPPPAARSSPAPVALGEIHAKIVGDGTGLVRALVSKESKSNSFGGMNFNSYWAYFEEDMHKPEDSVRDWLYPATNHLCFNEGWSWWIRLLSWNSTPVVNMMDYISYLFAMQSAEIETKRLPTIERLAKVFNCTFNPIVSIGFVVRSETLDTFPPAPYVNGATAFDGEKRFWSIVHAYPHVESILRDSGRYTLLHNYYGPTRGTYYTRRNMSYYQDTVAGEGWYGLGISVGFTSPLISPGINCICLPTGFLAARLTAKQLDGSDGAAADARDEYSAFLTKLVEGLRAVDEILYNMFRHPRLFQSIFPLYFANGMADVTKNYTTEFRPQEIHWANGSGEAMFPKWSTEVLPLVMDTDITDEVVAKVEEICARHCRLHVETFHEWTKYSRYMRYYDDDMQYRPNKGWRPEADFPAIRCTQCKYANALQHSLHCVMCDATLPQYTRPSVTGEISMTVLAQ